MEFEKSSSSLTLWQRYWITIHLSKSTISLCIYVSVLIFMTAIIFKIMYMITFKQCYELILAYNHVIYFETNFTNQSSRKILRFIDKQNELEANFSNANRSVSSPSFNDLTNWRNEFAKEGDNDDGATWNQDITEIAWLKTVTRSLSSHTRNDSSSSRVPSTSSLFDLRTRANASTRRVVKQQTFIDEISDYIFGLLYS